MNIEELRDYCLSLPEATEKMPLEGFFHNHESLLTFNIGGHIFCMADINMSPVEATIKVDPDKINQLHEEYMAVGKPYNFSPTHWISVKADGDMPDKLIYSLIADSYHLVKEKE
ncbi:MAG: MmcQ/YjbR family DNA-binding protein [Duncaniella sp.]|nr:MmcQ/YjbR family DNA-binding protein [Duncaniella sp.]